MGSQPMCMNCGCGQPNNDMGKPENITADQFRKAAEANDQTLRESAQHILETVELLEASRRDSSGLAEPAAATGGQRGGRGTPASES
jgi:hypothetical protein